MYFSGQGKVYIGTRAANGEADVMRYVGNSPQFNLTFETDVFEHKESWSGQRATDLRLLREKSAAVSIILEEFTAKNLALALFGDDATVTGTSVTDEPLAGGSTSVAVGDYVITRNPDISAVVIKDSDVAPATLVEGTDYRIESAKHGSIEILNVGTYVQPFTIDYTFADYSNVRMLTRGLDEKWVRLEALNTAQADQPALIEVYRVAFDPAEELAWISDEQIQMTLNGSALVDATKDADTLLGPFGRVVDIAA